tara:strand:+ start:1298 stop:1765 length:468 start_codon:yes stop_codon:yes gene_type:complete
MGMDVQTYKDILSQFASGVTVVLVQSQQHGVMQGKTVSSFFSLSLDPLMVGFAVNKNSPFVELLKQAPQFSVNILAEDQHLLAPRFAKAATNTIAVDELAAHGGLNGALATLVCCVEQTVAAGDHTLVLATVKAGAVHQQAPPLVYWGRAYRQLK